MVGGGLFQSPPVTKKSPTPTEKSPTPTEKSPTVISKRRWTLEYSGGLEFSSPFMEQWTLDARGVLCIKDRKYLCLVCMTQLDLILLFHLVRNRDVGLGFRAPGISSVQ